MDPNAILNLTITGVPLAAGILIIVQALKVAGLVSTGEGARRANVVVSVILAGVWFARQIAPAAAPYIDTAFIALVGSLTAGLAYEGISAAVQKVRQPKADSPVDSTTTKDV